MTYDPSNIFAKILRGEIPCHKVVEDETALVFMDVMPQSNGHALIVPKTQARNIFDADPAVLAKILPLVQKIAIASKKAFNADGITVWQFNEPAGGQTVFHLHYHVIPRYEGVALKPHSGKMEDGAILAANAEKLRRAL